MNQVLIFAFFGIFALLFAFVDNKLSQIDNNINDDVKEIIEDDLVSNEEIEESNDNYNTLSSENKKQVDIFSDNVEKTLKDVSAIAQQIVNTSVSIVNENDIIEKLDDYENILKLYIEPDETYVLSSNNVKIKEDNTYFFIKKQNNKDIDNMILLSLKPIKLEKY